MPRNPVLGGVARNPVRSLSSLACLGFIGLMALAFWAGAIWIGQLVLRALIGG